MSKLYEFFGEMGSAEEINELAENLCNEGDFESLMAMAKENGLFDFADMYRDGEIPYLCDAQTAALGKIEVESAELKPKEIMVDWIEYLKCQIMEDDQLAKAVRKNGKNLKGMIGTLLKWSFGNQIPIDKEIVKAAGISAGRVTLGIPGMGKAKKLIREYYLGE